MESTKRHIVFLASHYPPYTSVSSKNGSVLHVSGLNAALVSLIAQRFHWTYSWLYLGPSVLINDSFGKKGLISYLLEGNADTVVGAIAPLAERFKFIDFTAPSAQGPEMILIPYPASSVDAYALGYPFQEQVWIAMAISLIAIVFFWYLSAVVLRKFKNFHQGNLRDRYTPIDYTVSVLLGQGNVCLNEDFHVRLIAGVWCLAAAVLIPAYCSTLTSYSMLPSQKPVIDSVNDVVKVPGLRLAVERGRGADAVLQLMAATKNPTDGGLAKALNNTTFRCNRTIECFNKVLNGRHVFINSAVVLKKLIFDDFKENSKCRLTLAKQPLSESFLIWGVAKRSKPYLSVLNQGLLDMSAYRLSDYWKTVYFKQPTECLKYVRSTQKKIISLLDTSSTFVLLTVGWGFIGLIFLFELVCFHVKYTASSK